MRAVDLHDDVADLARAAAPDPRPAAEHDPAADAGAPEDAEHRAVAAARAERGLGVGRHLDVVAERDRRAERACSAAWRAGSCPPSRAGSSRWRPCRRRRRRCPASRRPRGSAAAGSQPAAAAASRSARSIAAATSAGPPFVGVGRRACPSTACVGIDDDGLDLRSPEVDSAAQHAPEPPAQPPRMAPSRLPLNGFVPGTRLTSSKFVCARM